MTDEEKTREQLISELDSLREQLEALRGWDISTNRLQCAQHLAIGLAHNFNNILTPILGYAQLGIRALPQDSHIFRYLQEVETAATRAAELTDKLLAFSGRQIRDPRVLNVNELISGMESVLRRIVGNAISVELTLASDLWPTRIDPEQMERVLWNLADNAREAMPTGGRLVIGTANAVLSEEQARSSAGAAGECVLITVQDTGVGMGPEVSAYAFEPFFTTKEPWERDGMGLSICYGILVQNRGHIDVESAPLAGTEFRLYLPRAA